MLLWQRYMFQVNVVILNENWNAKNEKWRFLKKLIWRMRTYVLIQIRIVCFTQFYCVFFFKEN